MDKKALANFAAFGLCFLLWLKFGPEIFWLILAIGFVFVVLVIVFTIPFQLLFINYYEKKFLPGFKRIAGREFPLDTIPEERRKKIKAGLGPLFGLILVLLLIFLLISGRIRLY
jgi:hypothetical protein